MTNDIHFNAYFEILVEIMKAPLQDLDDNKIVILSANRQIELNYMNSVSYDNYK